MKKIIVLFLTALLLASAIFAVPASAQGDKTEEYKAAFERCLVERYQYSEEDVASYEGQYMFTYHGDSNGYAVCSAALGPTPMEMTAQIGNYKFFNQALYIPDQLGIFLIKGQEVIPLWEAYQMGIANVEEVAAMFPAGNRYGMEALPLGDMDMNGALSLQDILSMQKIIAQIVKMEELPSNGGDMYLEELSDLNHDGKLTVADVLLAQRVLAGEQLPWVWLPLQES